MIVAPSQEFGKFVWTVVMIAVVFALGWWLTQAPGRQQTPVLKEAVTVPPADGLFWFKPVDFVGTVEGPAPTPESPAAVIEETPPTPPAEPPTMPAAESSTPEPAQSPAVTPVPVPAPVPEASSEPQPSEEPATPKAPPEAAVSNSRLPVPSLRWSPSIKVEHVLSKAQVKTKARPKPELEAFDRMIQQRLQDIWMPPLDNEVPPGKDHAIIKFIITRDGSVMKNNEEKPSGSPVMDRSVRYATAVFINAGQPVPESYQPAEYEVFVEFRLR